MTHKEKLVSISFLDGIYGYKFVQYGCGIIFIGLTALGVFLVDYPLIVAVCALTCGGLGFAYVPNLWLEPLSYKNGSIRLTKSLKSQSIDTPENISYSFQKKHFSLLSDIKHARWVHDEELSRLRAEHKQPVV